MAMERSEIAHGVKKRPAKKAAKAKKAEPMDVLAKDIVITMLKVESLLREGDVPPEMAKEIKDVAKKIEKTVEKNYLKITRLEQITIALEDITEGLTRLANVVSTSDGTNPVRNSGSRSIKRF